MTQTDRKAQPTPGPKRHIPTIFQARRDGSFRWICSCGAESDYFKGRKAAENDHDEHVTSLARIDQ